MELAKDNEGELGECLVARYKQQDGLLQEQGEGICPPEADHDQVGSVEPCEVEGASAVNRCTRTLGGIETPRPFVVARFPGANVPVCVVKGTSVEMCAETRA